MNTIKKIGKIYAITGPVGEGLNVPKKYYIGSTKLRLEDRYSLHIIKSFSKNCNSNQELYKLIKEHGKDKFNIKCIEKVFATNEELVKLVGGGDQEPDYKNAAKRKLLQRERHYFEIYKQKYTENVLNKNRPILTDDERDNYYNERRDHILNLHKKYYKRDRVDRIT